METLVAENVAQRPTAELEKLYGQVEDWVTHSQERNGDSWRVSYGVVRPNIYNRPGVKDIYGLIIEAPEEQGSLHLRPVRTDGEGPPLVELYAIPTLVRVRLREKADKSWEIETDGGIPFRRPWERESFLTLIKDMLHVQ